MEPCHPTQTESLRPLNSRAKLVVAIAVSLAALARSFGQPVIVRQPQNQTNLVGTTATFAVTAVGGEKYQWRSYGSTTAFTNIPLATYPSLVLTNVQPTSRKFAVVVTDAAGLSTTSSPLASLTVLTPPSIAIQPAVQIMTTGATATFSVTATGTAPLAYQWRFNGVDMAGGIYRNLSLSKVQSDHAGEYSVVVANAFGFVASQAAALMFTAVHRFEGIASNPDHGIELKLAGVVPRNLAPYYDLYPLEVSPNLVDWAPLATVQRRNDSSEALSHRDSSAASFEKRFYRTPTNFFATPFAKPSGPYAVGTVSRLLTDPSRIRNTTPRTNSFMVTFWYPAEGRAGVFPAPYVESVMTSISPPSGAPSYWDDPAAVARFVTHAQPDLPVATREGRYPVVIFSHGMGGHRRQNTDILMELASHGYVVLAMDHKDAFASVFPGGQVIRGAPGTPCEALNMTVVDYRTHDILFVMNELSRLNAADALLAGRLDLERLGAIGKSMGGMAVAEVGRIDARCKTVVLLDAGYTLEMPPDLLRFGLRKPFLSMSSTMDRPICDNFGEWLSASLSLFNGTTRDAFWCQIRNSTHNGFSDRSSVINDTGGTGNPTSASRSQSETIRACTVSFLDKYLKAKDDHLLDDPAAVYPNVINFQRK